MAWQAIKKNWGCRRNVRSARSFTTTTHAVADAHVDVLIIGGGAMGASTAYWLRKAADMSVLVAERDPTYAQSSTCLSVGGVRQQFSLLENIKMSLFGAQFLKHIGKHLAVDNVPLPDVQFQPYGYLLLASEKSANRLKKNSERQCILGAKNVLLSENQLKNRFGWINTNGVELGCLGLEHEGWFDPWALLQAFKVKSLSLGAKFVKAEAIGFHFSNEHSTTKKVSGATLKLPNGQLQTINFQHCVIAAGAHSATIAAALNQGDLTVTLPIEPRKRYVFCYHCAEGPGLDTPLVVDPSGAYFRREGLGGCYIAGMSPESADEPSVDNLDVDYSFYTEKVWPIIAHRVPAFEKSKLQSAWAGFYEFNTFDANGVIGKHPEPALSNILFACGFSGHGIQHAPAVGRAISELLIHGQYKTIDLSRFAFDRHCLGDALLEDNIV